MTSRIVHFFIRYTLVVVALSLIAVLLRIVMRGFGAIDAFLSEIVWILISVLVAAVPLSVLSAFLERFTTKNENRERSGRTK